MKSNLKFLKKLKLEFAKRDRKRFGRALVFTSGFNEQMTQSHFVSKLERYFDEVRTLENTFDWISNCKTVESESVDYVIILSGIEQCADPFRLVTEIWRCLALNGRLRICFKNARSIKSKIEFLTGNIDRYSYRGTLKNRDGQTQRLQITGNPNSVLRSDPVFHTPYDLKNIRDLCRSAGFYLNDRPSDLNANRPTNQSANEPADQPDDSFVKKSVSNFLISPIRVVLKSAAETAKEKSEIDAEKRLDLGFR